MQLTRFVSIILMLLVFLIFYLIFKNGLNVLHMSVSACRLDIVKELLLFDANVNAKTNVTL